MKWLWKIPELVKEIYLNGFRNEQRAVQTAIRLPKFRVKKIFGAPYPNDESGDVLLLWDFGQRLKTPDVRRTVSGDETIRLLILTERDGSL